MYGNEENVFVTCVECRWRIIRYYAIACRDGYYVCDQECFMTHELRLQREKEETI